MFNKEKCFIKKNVLLGKMFYKKMFNKEKFLHS